MGAHSNLVSLGCYFMCFIACIKSKRYRELKSQTSRTEPCYKARQNYCLPKMKRRNIHHLYSTQPKVDTTNVICNMDQVISCILKVEFTATIFFTILSIDCAYDWSPPDWEWGWKDHQRWRAIFKNRSDFVRMMELFMECSRVAGLKWIYCNNDISYSDPCRIKQLIRLL